MKRFGKNIILFFAIVVSIFIVLNVYQSAHRYEPPVYFKKYDELFSEKNSGDSINGIIIGNSRVAFSLKPTLLEKTGTRYYNFGYGRGDLEFYLDWFEHAFPHYDQKIDHCIIAVDRHFFKANNGRLLEQDAEYFSWSAIVKLMSNSEIDRTALFLNTFPAFKYRKKLLTSLSYKGRDSFFESDKYDRGYIAFNKPFDPEEFSIRPVQNFTISTNDKLRFESLLDQLTADGITIHLIRPPQYKLPPEAHANLSHYLKRLSSEKKIAYFDFNDVYHHESFDNANNYSDVIHLNEIGSDLLSSILAQAINSSNETQVIED